MLHVICARCVAGDLHTIAPEPLECMCWRPFAVQWGDCKKKIELCLWMRLLLLLPLTGRGGQSGVQSVEPLQIQAGRGHCWRGGAHSHQAWLQGAVPGGCFWDHGQPRLRHCWPCEYWLQTRTDLFKIQDQARDGRLWMIGAWSTALVAEVALPQTNIINNKNKKKVTYCLLGFHIIQTEHLSHPFVPDEDSVSVSMLCPNLFCVVICRFSGECPCDCAYWVSLQLVNSIVKGNKELSFLFIIVGVAMILLMSVT